MANFEGKCNPQRINPHLEVSVSKYFGGAYALNTDQIRMIIDSGQVDLNCVHNYGQTKREGKPDEHMLQNFGSIKEGKVTCQVFEKIDRATETEVKVILHLLKVKHSYVKVDNSLFYLMFAVACA